MKEPVSHKLECTELLSKEVPGMHGKPSFGISREQPFIFIEQGFKVEDVSAVLGVSVRSVERTMATFGFEHIRNNDRYYPS